MAVVYGIYEVIFSGRLPWPFGSKPLRSTPELATPTRLSLVDQPSWFSSPPSGLAVHFVCKFILFLLLQRLPSISTPRSLSTNLIRSLCSRSSAYADFADSRTGVLAGGAIQRPPRRPWPVRPARPDGSRRAQPAVFKMRLAARSGRAEPLGALGASLL
jgi:hypothetical protein